MLTNNQTQSPTSIPIATKRFLAFNYAQNYFRQLRDVMRKTIRSESETARNCRAIE